MAVVKNWRNLYTPGMGKEKAEEEEEKEEGGGEGLTVTDLHKEEALARRVLVECALQAHRHD